MKEKVAKFFRQRRRENQGFTLVEIVIVLVILGIVAAISVPIVVEQRRQAIISTVKSDVKSSVATIVTQTGNRADFIATEDFVDNAAITGDNNLVLLVTGEGDTKVACIWGSHVFGKEDVVSYHYSSERGTVDDGGCIGQDNYDETIIIVGTGPDTDDEHEEPTVTPTPIPTTPPVVVVTPTPTPTVSSVSTPTASPSTSSPQTTPVSTPKPTVTPTVTPTVVPTVAPAPVKPPVTEPTVIPSGKGKNAKYPVCHYAGGSWHLIVIAGSAVVNGHSGHTMDVIPPIAGMYAGKNWDSTGWEKFNKYCS